MGPEVDLWIFTDLYDWISDSNFILLEPVNELSFLSMSGAFLWCENENVSDLAPGPGSSGVLKPGKTQRDVPWQAVAPIRTPLLSSRKKKTRQDKLIRIYSEHIQRQGDGALHPSRVHYHSQVIPELWRIWNANELVRIKKSRWCETSPNLLRDERCTAEPPTLAVLYLQPYPGTNPSHPADYSHTHTGYR